VSFEINGIATPQINANTSRINLKRFRQLRVLLPEPFLEERTFASLLAFRLFPGDLLSLRRFCLRSSFQICSRRPLSINPSATKTSTSACSRDRSIEEFSACLSTNSRLRSKRSASRVILFSVAEIRSNRCSFVETPASAASNRDEFGSTTSIRRVPQRPQKSVPSGFAARQR